MQGDELSIYFIQEAIPRYATAFFLYGPYVILCDKLGLVGFGNRDGKVNFA